MIKIEKIDTYGWESAVRGMRNPMNSWDKSDSFKHAGEYDLYRLGYRNPQIGPNDLELMKKLVKAGSDHSKFMRMINVTMDITAPLYWWKEFDTYKVSTVRNSCSTMHKIHAKEFTLDDFSCEHLLPEAIDILKDTVTALNDCRDAYIHYDKYLERDADFIRGLSEKDIWWQMIQLLPSSYNQKATVQLNYAVLRNMYHSRKNHKLDEWREFCRIVETLPYAKELICDEQS